MAFPRDRAQAQAAGVREWGIICRTDVVGILPTEAALTRLVGIILLGPNDEWAARHRRMMRPCRA